MLRKFIISKSLQQKQEILELGISFNTNSQEIESYIKFVLSLGMNILRKKNEATQNKEFLYLVF